jgi:hypothetical protein
MFNIRTGTISDPGLHKGLATGRKFYISQQYSASCSHTLVKHSKPITAIYRHLEFCRAWLGHKTSSRLHLRYQTNRGPEQPCQTHQRQNTYFGHIHHLSLAASLRPSSSPSCHALTSSACSKTVHGSAFPSLLEPWSVPIMSRYFS